MYMSSIRLYSCGYLRYPRLFNNGLSVPLPLRRCGQIDAADQQRKLLARQLHAVIF
jgi:hypothetical protein